MKKLDDMPHLPQFIFQKKFFGLLEVAYSKDNAYMSPVARCWRDKYMFSLLYGFEKLS
jgi:hypothetical protein